MNKNRIENREDETDIYEIIDIFFNWKKIFLLIVALVFIASIIMAYFHNKNKKNELSIEFRLTKERILNDELFQKSGLIFPQLDIENILEYIKTSTFQSNIPIIQNIKKGNNSIYFLESENGEELFNEKDKIFFEMEKYISDRIREIIITEEKKTLENIEYFSLEMMKSTNPIKIEELRKTIEIYLEQMKALTGVKFQKKYQNMIVIDVVSMDKKDNFLKIFTMINIFGIAAGMFAIMLCEFWKRYNFRKVSVEIK